MAHGIVIQASKVALQGVTSLLSVTGAGPGDEVELLAGDKRSVGIADADGIVTFSELRFVVTGDAQLRAETTAGDSVTTRLRVLPGWVSISPPLLSIIAGAVVLFVLLRVMGRRADVDST